MSSKYVCTCGWEFNVAFPPSMKCDGCGGVGVLMSQRDELERHLQSLELRVDGVEAAIGELRKQYRALNSSVEGAHYTISSLRQRIKRLEE